MNTTPAVQYLHGTHEEEQHRLSALNTIVNDASLREIRTAVWWRSKAAPQIVSYRLERQLKFDPAKEQFVGDAEANKMLTRNYRKPYAVPEKV